MRKFFTCIAVVIINLSLFGVGVSNPDPHSELNNYKATCLKAVKDDDFFMQFKRASGYIPILEHLGKCTGVPYLSIIKKQTPEFMNLIEEFRENDLIGNPRTDVYDDIGVISSTTIRYMKVASDLLTRFGSLDGASIVEIGAGYGGQCFVLSRVCKFKHYTIVDFPEVIQLVQKYLESHGIYNVTYVSCDDDIKDRNFDLIISNYAFNESGSYQEKYEKQILSMSCRGYITGGGHRFPERTVNYLRSCGLPCEICPEEPQTAPHNVLVIWDNS